MTFTPTPLDHTPLHPPLRIKRWACSEPENPDPVGLAHDFRCRACFLHAKAMVLSGTDPVRNIRYYLTGEKRSEPLSSIVQRHAPFHGFGGSNG